MVQGHTSPGGNLLQPAEVGPRGFDRGDRLRHLVSGLRQRRRRRVHARGRPLGQALPCPQVVLDRPPAQGRHGGQQRIGGEIGAPRILDGIRLQLPRVRQDLETGRHAAQEPLGSQHLLAERMDGRHGELVAFVQRQTQTQHGRLSPRGVEGGEPVQQYTEALLAFSGLRAGAGMGHKGRQLPAGALTQFTGRVLGEGDQHHLADVLDHPVHQEPRQQVRDGPGLAGARAGFDDRQPGRDVGGPQVEISHRPPRPALRWRTTSRAG